MPSEDDIILSQIETWEKGRLGGASNDKASQVVTVSRQYGSRGSYIATRLSEMLGYGRFHRELIDKICRNQDYYDRVLALLSDAEIELMRFRTELILKPKTELSENYIVTLCHLVFAMSRLGSVVIIGRAGNFILGMDEGFHVRYVAPAEKRIDNLTNYKRIDSKMARDEISKIKRERRDFVRSNFGIGIDDPSCYDLILNTAHIGVEEAVGVTIEAYAAKMDKFTQD